MEPIQPTNPVRSEVHVVDSSSTYNGWLVSNSFFKRALAIFGHLIVIQFLLGIILFVILLVGGFSLASVMQENANTSNDESVQVNQVPDASENQPNDIVTDETNTNGSEETQNSSTNVEVSI